jgi:putative oxidoreductase
MTKSQISTKWQAYSPQLLSLLRIVAAILFIQPGAMKLFGYPIAMPGGNTADFPSEIWFAGVLEVFGGAMMLFGFCTRPVAFILSGEMAVAYFQAHAPHGFWTIVNHGADAVLFCFIWLYISSAGAGPWSLDAKRRKL